MNAGDGGLQYAPLEPTTGSFKRLRSGVQGVEVGFGLGEQGFGGEAGVIESGFERFLLLSGADSGQPGDLRREALQLMRHGVIGNFAKNALRLLEPRGSRRSEGIGVEAGVQRNAASPRPPGVGERHRHWERDRRGLSAGAGSALRVVGFLGERSLSFDEKFAIATADGAARFDSP